jgi:hypothetical protein
MTHDEMIAKITGMDAKSAQVALEENGYTVRIDAGQAMTMDYREDRMTITVADDKVSEARVG